MNYKEQIEWLRGFEIDHSPDGWPAIRMREISAMCDAVESLLAENERLKHNLTSTEQTMREYQELAAKRMEEIAKYRDAPVVAELTQYGVYRTMEGCGLQVGAKLIVKPGENKQMKLNLPKLADGEIYVGAIGDALGNLHHVILLPGDNDDATHEAQIEWAKSIGGDLPNRIEQAMLWANHRDLFQKDWYWSNEINHAESGWAWGQTFYYGNQYGRRKDFEYRARAVRRLPIE